MGRLKGNMAQLMRLSRSPYPLPIIAFAGAGFFWLVILLWVSATDFMLRSDFPPCPGPAVGAAGAVAQAAAR
jgi:hypothetical protein